MSAIPDWFQTIAEIGIGLAGFSGLVVALRRNPGPLTYVQKYRIRVLFAMSFGAVLLALFPYLLAEIGVASPALWRICSLAMVGWSVMFATWWIGRSFQVRDSAPEIFQWHVFTTMAVGHLINLSLQVALTFGAIESRLPGIFGCGLMWYLIHASQQFARMLFIQPVEKTNAEE